MRQLNIPDFEIMSPEERRRAVNARRRFLGVWTCVGGILLAAVVIYLLNILSAPMGVIIWATIIVFCLRGIVNGLEKRGVNRGLGTAIAYLVMFAVLGALSFLMFSPMFGFGSQFANLLESIPGYVQSVIDWGNKIYYQYSDLFENESVRQGINDVLAALGSWATTFASEGPQVPSASAPGWPTALLPLALA